MKQLTMIWVVFYAGFFIPPGIAEASSPEMYRPLQRVDFASQTITLGGRTYPLAKDVRWFGIGKTRPVYALPLMTGRSAGVVVEPVDGGYAVTEVWIKR